MASYIKALRQFNRDVWLTLAVWALLAFAYFGVMAVLFNLYLLRLGHAPPFIGLLVGVGQLTWALCALPAGVVGTRLGTRTTMFLGIAIITGGWILLLLAEALPASLPLAGLFAGWMLSWAGGQLPGWWATQVGATLEQSSPYRAALWLMPLACGLAGLVFLLTRRVQPSGPVAVAAVSTQPVHTTAGRGLLIFIGLVVLCQAMGEGVVRAFFNVYLDVGLHVPTAQIGTIFSMAQVLPIVAALSTPVIMARLGKAVTMSLTMSGIAVGLLLLALTTGATLAGVGYLAILALGAILGTTLTMFSQEAVPEAWRTTVAAVFTLGFALGSSLSALVGGYVVATLGFSALFLSGMTAVFLALALLLSYMRLTSSAPIIATPTSQPLSNRQLAPEGS